MKYFFKLKKGIEGASARVFSWYCKGCAKLNDKKGQGATEYAILVGVLVVIAILAIVIFKPKLQELWDAITEGMNQL